MKNNEKIKYARKIRGITQKKLGELLGYSEAHICHFEKGKRKITPESIKKIENILGISLNKDEFFIETKNESKADKLYKIIKYLFANPDNYKELDKIWYE